MSLNQLRSFSSIGSTRYIVSFEQPAGSDPAPCDVSHLTQSTAQDVLPELAEGVLSCTRSTDIAEEFLAIYANVPGIADLFQNLFKAHGLTGVASGFEDLDERRQRSFLELARAYVRTEGQGQKEVAC